MTTVNPYAPAIHDQEAEPDVTVSSKPGLPLHGIAIVHAAYAFLLGMAIVLASHPLNSGNVVESIPWVMLMLLFMTMSIGLWKGRSWARDLSLFLHSFALKAAVVGLSISTLIIIFAPKAGIAMALVRAIYAAIAFVPLILVSVFVVRCLRRGKKNP